MGLKYPVGLAFTRVGSGFGGPTKSSGRRLENIILWMDKI